MILGLYKGLTILGAPLISRYLEKRKLRGKEHPTRFQERFGITELPRPNGKLVWLHGASVGEAISLLPLIDEILKRHPQYSILLTTGTVTSAKLMEQRLPSGVIHQFIPVDRLPYVRGFLDHWQPDLAIWSESELWPNLLCETHKRGIKMALINARMSEKSLKKWQWAKGFIGSLLKTFDLCLAQTEEDGTRYKQLGARKVACLGNLKYAAPDLPCDMEELNRLNNTLQNRPLWMAASTHPGEEELLGRVHQGLTSKLNNPLCLIAPRHPERGDQIVADLRAMGLNVAQRSNQEPLSDQTEVYIADTLGEMGLFYRLSPIVFIGKSLEPLGGQNPLEPARLDCALISGPYMTNFSEIMADLQAADAISIVEDEQALEKEIAKLMENQDTLTGQAERAKNVTQAKSAVLGQTMDALAPLFNG